MKKRNTISDIVQSEIFSEIDIHFAKFVTRLDNKNDPDIFLGAALVSHATGKGDVCLELSGARDQLLSAFADDDPPFQLPTPNEWEEKLISSRVVGRPGETFPLILAD